MLNWNKLKKDPWNIKRKLREKYEAESTKITASKMEPNNKKEVVENERIDEEND